MELSSYIISREYVNILSIIPLPTCRQLGVSKSIMDVSNRQLPFL